MGLRIQHSACCTAKPDQSAAIKWRTANQTLCMLHCKAKIKSTASKWGCKPNTLHPALQSQDQKHCKQVGLQTKHSASCIAKPRSKALQASGAANQTLCMLHCKAKIKSTASKWGCKPNTLHAALQSQAQKAALQSLVKALHCQA